MPEVPTTDDLKGTATDAAIPGTTLALGETIGRSTLGPGLGTALGGIVAASTEDGSTAETMGIMAVERGMNELFAGASSSGGGNQNRRI